MGKDNRHKQDNALRREAQPFTESEEEVSAAFADWQPKYAEQGIATFPVENKRPSIKGWQRVGLGGSAQLAISSPMLMRSGFSVGRAAGSRCSILTATMRTQSRTLFRYSGARLFSGAPAAATMQCRFATTAKADASDPFPICQLMFSVRGLPWRRLVRAQKPATASLRAGFPSSHACPLCGSPRASRRQRERSPEGHAQSVAIWSAAP